MNWTLDKPTAATIANIVAKIPPMIGSGIITKTAPNFSNIPRMSMIRAAYWTTERAPTLSKGKDLMYFNATFFYITNILLWLLKGFEIFQVVTNNGTAKYRYFERKICSG